MKKTIILALVLGVAAAIGGRMALRSEPGPRATPRAVAPNEVVSANGTVEGARPEAALRPEIAGILTAVNVHENDAVVPGQVLAELSNETQKAQVALARADLTVARQHLKKLEAGERAQVVSRARAVEAAKQSAYHLAQDDWHRSQNASSSVSAGDLDKTRTQLTLAKAEWDQAKADLAMLLEGTRTEDLAAARGQVDIAEAKLSAAEAELAKTRLTAPTAGKVLQVFAERGELACPTSPQPVMIVADLSRRRVRAFVEELDVDRVETGANAMVTADGLPGKSFSGKVALALPRMGKRAPQSDAPSELKDVYYREVLIDLDAGEELPTNLRVQVRIQAKKSQEDQ